MNRITFYLVFLGCMWCGEGFGQVDTVREVDWILPPIIDQEMFSGDTLIAENNWNIDATRDEVFKFKPFISLSCVVFDNKKLYKFNHSRQVFIAANGRCSEDKSYYILLLEAETGREIHQVTVESPVLSVEFNEDDSLVIILTKKSEDIFSCIYLWDLRTFQFRKVITNSHVTATGFFGKKYFIVIDRSLYSSPEPEAYKQKIGEILFFNIETDSIKEDKPLIRSQKKKLQNQSFYEHLTPAADQDLVGMNKYYDILNGILFELPKKFDRDTLENNNNFKMVGYDYDLNSIFNLDDNLLFLRKDNNINRVIDLTSGKIIYKVPTSANLFHPTQVYLDTSNNKLIWYLPDACDSLAIWDYNLKKEVRIKTCPNDYNNCAYWQFSISSNNNNLLIQTTQYPHMWLYYKNEWRAIFINDSIGIYNKFYFNSKDELIMTSFDHAGGIIILYKLDYNNFKFIEIFKKRCTQVELFDINTDSIKNLEMCFYNNTFFVAYPTEMADSIFWLDTKMSKNSSDWDYFLINKALEKYKENQYILFSDSTYGYKFFYIFDRMLNEILSIDDSIKSVLGYVNSNLLLCIGTDNILRFIDKNKGTIAKMYVTQTVEIIQLENSNYYTGSKKTDNLIHFQKNYQNYSFEELDPLFNRPDIVWAALGAPQEVVDRYSEAVAQRLLYLKLPKDISPTGDFHLPEIIVTNDPHQTITGRADMKNIRFQVSDTSGLAYINVYINGVPLHTKHGFSIQTPLKEVFSVDILLGDGSNRVDMVVLNRLGGRKIKTYNFFHMPPIIKPDTFYYVGIGINEYADSSYLPRLRYAVKDIRAMVDSLYSVYGGRLKVDTLIGNQVTKEALLKIKTRLLQSGVNDIIMVQFSGHGVTPDQEFYFPTAYSTSSDITKTGIGIKLIEAFMDSLPSRKKVLLMDACESGLVAIDAPIVPYVTVPADSTGGNSKSIGGKAIAERQETPIEAMQRLFNDYVEGNGTTVISASTGYASALESSAFLNGHGALTAAVLSTFKGGTSLSELKQHVIQYVSDLTGSLQMPTIRAENLKNDFELWEGKK